MSAMKPGAALTLGSATAGQWLAARDLQPEPRWFVEIVLADGIGSRFEINLYAEEWGFAFHHAGRASWIRVTDIAFVHGRDDYALLAEATTPEDARSVIETLEQAHAIRLPRDAAAIRTNLAAAEPAIRAWLEAPVLRPRRRTREL